ncbi:radical SAM peptide maturase (CXXX-repeat target family)/CXXX repeat peptide maturase [Dielma fastidiosa]|uniref:Radical SAM peptide maturase (CXXX-repeat target family)/CXXX repeat peptide maturase n=2 Tax=Dielma fastidiosa TaxID=1034346 RepID=A0A318KRA9_9FIRM|nr:radical SAM peptide maturase (CXXX-repeat target family)/CXXX repeat peptide maturase [Dielma fastidiosa]
MTDIKYTVGKNIESWKDGEAQTVTFVVTEDCNLRCKYCYITHKSSGKKMNLETAKKFIDMLFSSQIIKKDAVIIEFIGGEPLIEIDLIDQITDYFKIKAYEMNHDWYWNYRINICTNGVNYSSKEVQKYIKKNQKKMSLAITIDGVKIKHDMQRVTIDNQGSYDKIMKSVPLWLSQFPGATKVTFASQDLKYLKDSILSLWENKITDVASNVVFENVWQDGDDIILENQLNELADYVIENKLYNKYYCTFFDDTIGYYYNDDDLKKTYCGAGKMIALGPNGNIYPCIRYKDYSLNNQKEWIIGHVDTEIDMEKVRPFVLATTNFQSDQECIKCPIASGCAFCQGFNYDDSIKGTIYSRAKYICKMHKARVRANDYYFSKLYNKFGINKDELEGHCRRQLFILLANDYVSYCNYKNIVSETGLKMSSSNIEQVLNFARYNFFEPVFIHSKNTPPLYLDIYENYHIKHYFSIKMYDLIDFNKFKDIIFVFEIEDIPLSKKYLSVCNTEFPIVFNISEDFINCLSEYVDELLNYTNDLRVNITDMSNKFSLDIYKQQLTVITNKIVELNHNSEKKKKMNLITNLDEDALRNGCYAGEKSFIVSPDGDIYTCCAMYSENLEKKCGTIFTEFKDKQCSLYELNSLPLCKNCKCSQCGRCSYLNYTKTNELNIPPSFQCKKSVAEYNASLAYLNQLNFEANPKIKMIDSDDPIEIWIQENNTSIGYYKYKEEN